MLDTQLNPDSGSQPSTAPSGRPSGLREESYTRDILTRVHDNEAVSQRSLAKELGIALGLANLLLRRMVNRGFIRLVRIQPNRVLYFITPAGIAEKARMTVAYVARNVQSYRDARDRIRARFASISQESAWISADEKRIIFYGAGDVAEIGYICLQDTDLRLVGVVDPGLRREFFGLPVRSPDDLSGLTLHGEPFDRIVVMSLTETDGILSEFVDRGVPADRVCRLL